MDAAAGAECSAGTRDHDDVDRVVAGQIFDNSLQIGIGLKSERIEFLRVVEANGGNAVGRVKDNTFIGHRLDLSSL